MVVSELEYHMALIPTVEKPFNQKMKSDLGMIIPDILMEHKGSMKGLKVNRDFLHLHFSMGADFSPSEVAENIIVGCSQRLTRVHKQLEGFGRLFKDSIYIKSGSKPTRKQLDDFVLISSGGI